MARTPFEPDRTCPSAAVGSATWPTRLETTQEAPHAAPEPRGTVLVMDDDPLIRRVAARMLRSRGFEVLEAMDGNQALALCALAAQNGEPVRVALLDRSIPEGPGAMDVLPELLRQRPAPVCVVFSGWVETAQEVAAEGFFCGISKPFDTGDFIRTVDVAERAWRNTQG